MSLVTRLTRNCNPVGRGPNYPERAWPSETFGGIVQINIAPPFATGSMN